MTESHRTLSRDVFRIARVKYAVWYTLASLGLAFVLAFPTQAYDFPFSSSDIREAYFLSRQPNVADYLRKYTHELPDLNVGKEFVTRVRLETPFVQVVDQVSRKLNYSAQDATKDFYEKPMTFHVYLEVCYRVDAPLPHAVKVAVMQNNKEIVPKTDERSGSRPRSQAVAHPMLGRILRWRSTPLSLALLRSRFASIRRTTSTPKPNSTCKIFDETLRGFHRSES